MGFLLLGRKFPRLAVMYTPVYNPSFGGGEDVGVVRM